VVLIHRFFAPDVTTYAQMLDQYARHLSSIGHDVTVLCSPPSYNGAYKGDPVPRTETRDGVKVVRVRSPRADSTLGKYAGQVIFPLLVMWHLVTRRRPYDTVSVTTVPPVLMGLVGRSARLRARKTRIVYHCMDLYPEVAEALGVLNNRWVANAARWLDTRTVQNVDQVIVLSNDMANSLRERGVTRDIGVANNFILLEQNNVDRTYEFEKTDKVRFVFAGNLGRFQGIETLIEAIRVVAKTRTDFEFVFMGAGGLSTVLDEAAAAGLPIKVWSHRPIEQASAAIEDAQVAVVSLSPGVIDYAYPSKVLMYLELGRPILAVVEEESELAELVRSNNIGEVANPRSIDEVAGAISSMIDHHGEYASADISAVGRGQFSAETVLETWTDLYGLSMT